MWIYVLTTLLAFAIVYFFIGGRQYKKVQSILRHPQLNNEIERILETFKFDTNKLNKLRLLISEEMSKGLSASTHSTADIRMFNSYVRHLPEGNERGEVLALDLGGTNFRILRVTLIGNGEKPVVSGNVFVVPRSIMLGHGEDLFDHLAESLHKFIESENLLDQELPLGFTFSFPCTQCGLASAKLTSWTKGFTCDGVEGKDVVIMLQRAIDKKHLRVKITALINDTVGTLVACAYGAPDTAVGLIVGTGFNACYIERLSKVGTWDGDFDEPQQVIINTEWGALGSSGCLDWIMTSFDREVDRSSVNPGRQIFEKLVSEKKLLFIGQVEKYAIYSAPLVTPGAFIAKYVSDIETDNGINFEKTALVLEQLGMPNASYEDCAIIRHVCKIVSKRASALTAAGLACLMDRIVSAKRDNQFQNGITIGVDGSVYRYHPKFRNNVIKALNLLMDQKVKFTLKLSDDGSGIGAALVAYMDNRHQLKRRSS
ncbi:hypothetical protein GJ496_005054 [Pomphorhynchus laevis]|nr:hypothetical protein GJ496_005054 [Pomphorhynchus laevis]